MAMLTRGELGSLEWGRKTAGRLSRVQMGVVVRNMVYVQIREGIDALRTRLGLLRPTDINIDDLSPPDSKLVADSLKYAAETQVASLLHHSWRTYYFGALIAAHEDLHFDREIFFSSAILHDTGLTEANETPLNSCCFAVSGAVRACDHLENCGHDARTIGAVGQAISKHLNVHVPWQKHGVEAALVARGAICDVLGAGHRRISPGSAGQVIGRHPRDGLREALKFGTGVHLPTSRPDIIARVSGGKLPPTPFRIARSD